MVFDFGKEIRNVWTRRKRRRLVVQNSIIFQDNARVTQLLLSRTSCASGNWKFRNIRHTHPMSPCEYDLFAKVKEPLRGTRYNTRDELILVIRRWIRNIDKEGRADGVWRLPNSWQKVINKGGATILKVTKYCTPVNKAMSETSNSCCYFLSNPCIYWNHE